MANILDQSLRQILAGRKTITIGRVFCGEASIRFGLSHSPLYGTKPAYDGKTGRGGGFDPDRWTLRALLAHLAEFDWNDSAMVTIGNWTCPARDYRRETAAAE